MACRLTVCLEKEYPVYKTTESIVGKVVLDAYENFLVKRSLFMRISVKKKNENLIKKSFFFTIGVEIQVNGDAVFSHEDNGLYKEERRILIKETIVLWGEGKKFSIAIILLFLQKKIN